jgi:hypothetical protein
MAAPSVGVVGMSALRRDINQLTENQSSALYTQIKAAGKQAAEPVAAATRSSLPHDTGTISGTVRTSGTKTGAAVRMGSAKVPYAGWIEFGGNRPDGSSREYVKDGRYLFPAARGLAARAAQTYSDALNRVFGSDGIWTNTSDNPESVHD